MLRALQKSLQDVTTNRRNVSLDVMARLIPRCEVASIGPGV